MSVGSSKSIADLVRHDDFVAEGALIYDRLQSEASTSGVPVQILSIYLLCMHKYRAKDWKQTVLLTAQYIFRVQPQNAELAMYLCYYAVALAEIKSLHELQAHAKDLVEDSRKVWQERHDELEALAQKYGCNLENLVEKLESDRAPLAVQNNARRCLEALAELSEQAETQYNAAQKKFEELEETIKEGGSTIYRLEKKAENKPAFSWKWVRVAVAQRFGMSPTPSDLVNARKFVEEYFSDQKNRARIILKRI